MVNGIAQEMAQRCVELYQDVAVHLGGFADDIESDLLSQRAAQVAYHPRKRLDAISERPHSTGERLVVQPVGQIEGPPVEHLQLDQPLREELLTLERSMLNVSQCGLHMLGQVLSGQDVTKAIDGVEAS